MAWELVAIWVIVATAIALVLRDERRLRQDRLDRQARLYATSPEWRHREPPARRLQAIAPALDAEAIERKFIDQLQRHQVVSATN